MKVVFVGPSLDDGCGRRLPVPAGLRINGPARRGDILAAVDDGARLIGLIDGLFATTSSPGHKEILYALSRGVTVLGGASMGALRAAECASFGMVGVGRIFCDYVSGRRDRDADVCLAHAPAGLGWRPLTLPLVDLEAALAEARLPPRLSRRLLDAAHQLHYADRSWTRLLQQAQLGGADHKAVTEWRARSWFSQKQRDAAHLLARATESLPVTAPWVVDKLPLTRHLLHDMETARAIRRHA